MPEWFDNINDLPVDIVIVGAVISTLAFYINAKVDKILHEMFPNSGSSMRDSIDRIESKLDKHIDWHMDRTDG